MPPGVLGLAAGITLAVVAWGFLVFTAIRFGVSARDGESGAWAWLGLATLGAMACLFVGMMLVVRLSRALGITTAPSSTTAPPPERPPAGSEPAGSAPPERPSAGSEAANPYLDRLLHDARPAPAPPATRPPGGHRA